MRTALSRPRPRHAVAAGALLVNVFFAGFIFGWPALAKALAEHGFYLDDTCRRDNAFAMVGDGREETCELSQQSSIAFVYMTTTTVFIFSSLPGGIFLDRYGPMASSLISGALISSGFALVASGMERLITVGFGLVGAGSSLAYSTSFKSASLFPQAVRTWIITAINSFFDTAALFALASQRVASSLAAQGYGGEHKLMYDSLATLAAAHFSAWALAWHHIRSESHLTSSAAIGDADGRRGMAATPQAAVMDNRLLVAPEKYWPLSLRPFRSQLRSPQIWLLAAWAAVLQVRASYFLASINGRLSQLGDESGAYMRTLLWISPLSIALGPAFALVIERHGFLRVMYAVTALSAAFIGSLLVPYLPAQLVTFLLYTVVRAGMYPVAIGCAARPHERLRHTAAN
jgi:LAT3 family solute carrier family 43 protein 3